MDALQKISVKEDLERFLKGNRELLFNERDFQMRLAVFLIATKHYDDVDLEYHLPVGQNMAFDEDYKPWNTEKPSIDIVLRAGNDYIPIELKYKLKAVSGCISRFGEKSDSVEIIPNQSAQNLGRYAFWKDVKRLELVKKHYKNVHYSFAIFLTNDASYQKSNLGADYYSFGMNEERTISGRLDWKTPKDAYPPIQLDGSYRIKWEQISMHTLMPDMFYTMIQI